MNLESEAGIDNLRGPIEETMRLAPDGLDISKFRRSDNIEDYRPFRGEYGPSETNNVINSWLAKKEKFLFDNPNSELAKAVERYVVSGGPSKDSMAWAESDEGKLTSIIEEDFKNWRKKEKKK